MVSVYSKYFIAIVPPVPILEQVEGLKQELFEQFGLKGALRSPAHITLHRPFQFKALKEEPLIAVLNTFSFAPFDVHLSYFNCFEPRVVFIDVKPSNDLINLHAQLAQFAKRNLQLFNEVEDLRGFHPHVTLASRDLKKNQFVDVYQFIKTKTFEARFTVRNIALLRLEKKWEVIEYIGCTG
jgi:2'-5' RNA ligase